MNEMVIDRNEFIAWCSGILLDVSSDSTFVANELACRDAEDALDRGEAVLLSEDGRLIGRKIVLKDGFYIEKEV